MILARIHVHCAVYRFAGDSNGVAAMQTGHALRRGATTECTVDCELLLYQQGPTLARVPVGSVSCKEVRRRCGPAL